MFSLWRVEFDQNEMKKYEQRERQQLKAEEAEGGCRSLVMSWLDQNWLSKGIVDFKNLAEKTKKEFEKTKKEFDDSFRPKDEVQKNFQEEEELKKGSRMSDPPRLQGNNEKEGSLRVYGYGESADRDQIDMEGVTKPEKNNESSSPDRPSTAPSMPVRDSLPDKDEKEDIASPPKRHLRSVLGERRMEARKGKGEGKGANSHLSAATAHPLPAFPVVANRGMEANTRGAQIPFEDEGVRQKEGKGGNGSLKGAGKGIGKGKGKRRNNYQGNEERGGSKEGENIPKPDYLGGKPLESEEMEKQQVKEDEGLGVKVEGSSSTLDISGGGVRRGSFNISVEGDWKGINVAEGEDEGAKPNASEGEDKEPSWQGGDLMTQDLKESVKSLEVAVDSLDAKKSLRLFDLPPSMGEEVLEEVSAEKELSPIPTDPSRALSEPDAEGGVKQEGGEEPEPEEKPMASFLSPHMGPGSRGSHSEGTVGAKGGEWKGNSQESPISTFLIDEPSFPLSKLDTVPSLPSERKDECGSNGGEMLDELERRRDSGLSERVVRFLRENEPEGAGEEEIEDKDVPVSLLLSSGSLLLEGKHSCDEEKLIQNLNEDEIEERVSELGGTPVQSSFRTRPRIRSDISQDRMTDLERRVQGERDGGSSMSLSSRGSGAKSERRRRLREIQKEQVRQRAGEKQREPQSAGEGREADNERSEAEGHVERLLASEVAVDVSHVFAEAREDSRNLQARVTDDSSIFNISSSENEQQEEQEKKRSSSSKAEKRGGVFAGVFDNFSKNDSKNLFGWVQGKKDAMESNEESLVARIQILEKENASLKNEAKAALKDAQEKARQVEETAEYTNQLRKTVDQSASQLAAAERRAKEVDDLQIKLQEVERREQAEKEVIKKELGVMKQKNDEANTRISNLTIECERALQRVEEEKTLIYLAEEKARKEEDMKLQLEKRLEVAEEKVLRLREEVAAFSAQQVVGASLDSSARDAADELHRMIEKYESLELEMEKVQVANENLQEELVKKNVEEDSEDDEEAVLMEEGARVRAGSVENAGGAHMLTRLSHLPRSQTFGRSLSSVSSVMTSRERFMKKADSKLRRFSKWLGTSRWGRIAFFAQLAVLYLFLLSYMFGVMTSQNRAEKCALEFGAVPVQHVDAGQV